MENSFLCHYMISLSIIIAVTNNSNNLFCFMVYFLWAWLFLPKFLSIMENSFLCHYMISLSIILAVTNVLQIIFSLPTSSFRSIYNFISRCANYMWEKFSIGDFKSKIVHPINEYKCGKYATRVRYYSALWTLASQPSRDKWVRQLGHSLTPSLDPIVFFINYRFKQWYPRTYTLNLGSIYGKFVPGIYWK